MTSHYGLGEEISLFLLEVQNSKFTPLALFLLRESTNFLSKHRSFTQILYSHRRLRLDDLSNDLEQCLASFISDQFQRDFPKINIIKEEYITLYVGRLISSTIIAMIAKIVTRQFINIGLYFYPINLVRDVCQTSLEDTTVVCESMRLIIRERKLLPEDVLSMVTDNIPLTGHEKSPFSEDELDAVMHYLKTKRKIYVNVILFLLNEMREDKMNTMFVSHVNNRRICNSKWLGIVFLAANE